MDCPRHSDIERTLGKLEAGQEQHGKDIADLRNEIRAGFDLLPSKVAEVVKRPSGARPPEKKDEPSWGKIIALMLVIGGAIAKAVFGF